MADPWSPVADSASPADPWSPVPTASPARTPGATGFGMVGQTIGDLFAAPGTIQHDPNAFERGAMGVAADYHQAIAQGPFLQPARAGMELLGYGRQPGESDASLHQRYSGAIDSARAKADAEVAATRVQGNDPVARVAQGALGLGAGIAANPQYLAIPGGGGSGVVGRFAMAGAQNAAIGGVSDAAAQLMDMAEGQKKNFDIEQNLQQTTAGALFGVAAHGAGELAHVVSPFVKDLFSKRGVDTLPAADPRSSPITPMTTDHIAVNAADHAQYQQLLQTGSVDDIKGFFQGRNGPQPSWSDVNQWVEHRDSPQPQSINGQPGTPNPEMKPDFNYEDAYNTHAENQWKEQNRQAVEDHVASKMTGWKNAPNVEVVHGPEDIADPKIRDEVTRADPNGDALGVFGSDGKARVFSGRVSDPDAASAVLFHEGLGHFGLAEKFGDRLNQVMETLYDRNLGQARPEADAYIKANPGTSKALAMEEVLAKRSQEGPIKPVWQQAVGSAVKQFGRKMGLNLAYSDAEVNHVLAMAHDAVINGKPSASANGFRGVPQNKFMALKDLPHPFPDSKVKDVLYHGTTGDFENFQKARDGNYLTDKPAEASGYADRYVGDEGANVRPVHVNVKNPMIVDEHTDFDPEYAWINGHDALIREGIGPMNSKHVIIRDPNQIKSVFDQPQNKFMRSASGNFDIEHRTDDVGAHILSVSPSEKLLPNVSQLGRSIRGVQSWKDANGQWRVGVSSLPKELRGKGLGREAYRLADEEARKDSSKLASDAEVSDNAARLWESAGAERNPSAVRWKDGAGWETKDGSPVYFNPNKFMRYQAPQDDVDYNKHMEERNPETKRIIQYMHPNEYHNAIGRPAPYGKPVDKLTADIQQNGLQKMPWIKYDKNGNVTDQEGRHRVEALKSLGYDDVPVVIHQPVTNKFMTRDQLGLNDEDKPLPFTQHDLNQHILLDHMLRTNTDENNKPLTGIRRQQLEDKMVRLYGDIPPEVLDDTIKYGNLDENGQHPGLSRRIWVTDNRTGERINPDTHAPAGTNGFLTREDAFKAIDSYPDQIGQHLGIDRLGTNNKFMTRSQMKTAQSPDYHSEDPERVFQALSTNYSKTSVPWEEIKANALKNGISPSTVKSLKATDPGELASRVYRLGAATNLADTILRELEQRIGTPQETQGDKVAYIKALADFNYMAPRFKGETSEAGRALNIAKAFPQYTNATLNNIGEMLREHGQDGLAALAENPDQFTKFVKQLQAIRGEQNTNPLGVQNMLSAVNKPYWEQYLTTFHMNSMLSALSTHVKAPIDMATGITLNVTDKILSMPIGAARQMYASLTGKIAKPGVEVSELANHISGLMGSVMDGEMYRAVLQAAKNGDSSYVVPKMNSETGQIASERTATQFANQFGAISNPRIPYISKPTDLISAQDTFFRSVEMNGNLRSLANREAREQLGPQASTTDVFTLGHSIALNPTNTMLKEAFAETNHTLLLNSNPVNRLIDRARLYSPGMNGGQRAVAFITSNLAPFIRVESNSLITRFLQRTPLAFLDPTGYTQAALKAGGARADIAYAKMAQGVALFGIYWGMKEVTGAGPDNVDKFKQMEASGWRPNAVHEDGRYNTGGQLGMSVNPFDPHNKMAQLVSSARQAYESAQTDKTASAQMRAAVGIKLALGSVMAHMADQSWLSDVNPFVQAAMAHGPEGQTAIQRFATGATASWVPSILRQGANLSDPVQRDTNATKVDGSVNFSQSVGNTLQNEIPGVRGSLPVKYSVYGTPLANGQSFTGVHTWIPGLSGNGTTETTDPAERELDRLNTISPKTVVTPVQRSFKLNENDLADYSDSGRKDFNIDEDGKVTLSPAQFEEYQHVAGRAIVDTVRQEMNSPAWQAMSDKEKVNEVKSIETDMKAAAKERMLFNK